MTPTLTRDPKPTVRPRSYRIVKGAKSEPELYQPRTVKRPTVTVKPERMPFFQRRVWWIGFVIGIALAAWPLGALIGSVVR